MMKNKLAYAATAAALVSLAQADPQGLWSAGDGFMLVQSTGITTSAEILVDQSLAVEDRVHMSLSTDSGVVGQQRTWQYDLAGSGFDLTSDSFVLTVRAYIDDSTRIAGTQPRSGISFGIADTLGRAIRVQLDKVGGDIWILDFANSTGAAGETNMKAPTSVSGGLDKWLEYTIAYDPAANCVITVTDAGVSTDVLTIPSVDLQDGHVDTPPKPLIAFGDGTVSKRGASLVSKIEFAINDGDVCDTIVDLDGDGSLGYFDLVEWLALYANCGGAPIE